MVMQSYYTSISVPLCQWKTEVCLTRHFINLAYTKNITLNSTKADKRSFESKVDYAASSK